MDRRTFLTSGPLALTGGLVGLFTGREQDSTRHRRLDDLLGAAEQNFAVAQDLVHRPHRYDEAKPQLAAALEMAAEAWLLRRGVETRLQPHYTWLFMACSRPDEITGIGWRAAHAALNLMRDCDLMPRYFAEDVAIEIRYTMIERSRRTLVRTLNTVANCIEGARHEALQV